MASRSGFEALRGAEVQTLDLVFQVSTSEEWAELLKGPLERAAGQHVAAVMDNAQMVQLLMLKGADNNALADDGVSPLCVAACCGHETAAVALLAGGADVSIACGERKTLILHLLAQQGSQQRHWTS